MPKKVRRGRGKSEEGRLEQLQQRAQAVEELNRKEEMLTLFLRDKLQKEQRNTAVNRLKLAEVWRTTLRQIQETELRAEAEVQRQAFERQLDDQDSAIEKLLRELREAERQDAQVWHVQAQHLERLQAQQDRRLRGVERRWGGILRRAGSTFGSEREQALDEFQRQHAVMHNLTLCAERRREEEADSVQQLYDDCQVHRDEFRLLPNDAADQKTLQESLADSEKLDVLFKEKTERNDNYRKSIERLQVASRRLKEKLSRVQLENRLQLGEQKAARDEVNQKCHELRDWLAGTRTEARDRLSRLSIQGDKASKKLQAAISKGEIVLRVGEICLKFENQPEISLPLSSSSLPSEEDTQLLTLHLTAAELQREAALQHRDHLSQENKQLRFLIRQYLEDATLDGCCTPLAVSQAPTSDVPPAADRRHTVIEAAHAIKHYL